MLLLTFFTGIALSITAIRTFLYQGSKCTVIRVEHFVEDRNYAYSVHIYPRALSQGSKIYAHIHNYSP